MQRRQSRMLQQRVLHRRRGREPDRLLWFDLSPTRAAARLATTYAIHEAKQAVDVLYDAAGASAIFANGPYERRFRDIHTVAQQLQGRKSHFRTVGAYRLGHEPDLTVV